MIKSGRMTQFPSTWATRHLPALRSCVTLSGALIKTWKKRIMIAGNLHMDLCLCFLKSRTKA